MNEREMFEKSFERPHNFLSLTDPEKWDIDKKLGILDWMGEDLTEEDKERMKQHYNYVMLKKEDNIKESKEQLLIRRVFNVIAKNHFQDHKMILNYTEKIIFPRSLGEDIAHYIQSKNPEHYHKKRKSFSNT